MFKALKIAQKIVKSEDWIKAVQENKPKPYISSTVTEYPQESDDIRKNDLFSPSRMENTETDQGTSRNQLGIDSDEQKPSLSMDDDEFGDDIL